MATIKCKTCGADLSATTKFCGTCGSPVEKETAVEEAAATVSNTSEVIVSKKSIDVKKFIIPAIAIIICIIAVTFAINLFKPSKYEMQKGSVYITQMEENVLIIPNGKNKVEIEGMLVDSSRNLDGTKAVALINEDPDTFNEGYSLYLITDKTQLISEEVYSFMFALSGDAVLYTTEYENSEDTVELYLYSGGSSTHISDDVSFSSICTISPDGKSVAYVTNDDGRYEGFVWNGKEHELGKDVNPIAVSDGAKYIYYLKNNTFYAQKGLNGDDREKLGDNVYSFVANKDLSQIIYYTNSRTYISRNGGPRDSLSGTFNELVVPNGTALRYGSNVIAYGVSNFSDTIYHNTEGSLIYINNKYETDSIARNVNYASLSSNGKDLTYLRGSSIYKTDSKGKNTEPVRIVDGDVEAFVATEDGNAVFFINYDDEIHYQKGTGKPVFVTDDFTNMGYSYYGALNLFKGKTLFYVSDEELYSSDGSRGKSVTGIDGEVEDLNTGNFSIYVSTYDYDDDSYLYYRSTDGKKFELLN